MLTRIIAFSSNISQPIENDSTVSVTVSDIKYANLIFVEHKKLLTENNLLNEQLNNYIQVNNQLVQVDSLRKVQLGEYKVLNQEYLDKIENLNQQLSSKSNTLKYWQVGGLTVSVGLLVFLLLK
jgi:hypothetical protein